MLLRSLSVELHIEEEGEKERHKRTERGAEQTEHNGRFQLVFGCHKPFLVAGRTDADGPHSFLLPASAYAYRSDAEAVKLP